MLYVGSLTDGLPLPLAQKAIYVDVMPKLNYWTAKEGSKVTKDMILERLIKDVKEKLKLKREPEIEWKSIGEDLFEEMRPIANVLFTWDAMPNLTNANDTTKLTYLFNTLDTELFSDENLRPYTENVDLGEYIREYIQLIFINVFIENYDFEYYSVTAEWVSQVLWYRVFQYLNKR